MDMQGACACGSVRISDRIVSVARFYVVDSRRREPQLPWALQRVRTTRTFLKKYKSFCGVSVCFTNLRLIDGWRLADDGLRMECRGAPRSEGDVKLRVISSGRIMVEAGKADS